MLQFKSYLLLIMPFKHVNMSVLLLTFLYTSIVYCKTNDNILLT